MNNNYTCYHMKSQANDYANPLNDYDINVYLSL